MFLPWQVGSGKEQRWDQDTGTKTTEGVEAHIMDHSLLVVKESGVILQSEGAKKKYDIGATVDDVANVREERLAKRLNGSYGEAGAKAYVAAHGVAIEYTPHYSFVPGAVSAICDVVPPGATRVVPRGGFAVT